MREEKRRIQIKYLGYENAGLLDEGDASQYV
jgi:hypothetical protein